MAGTPYEQKASFFLPVSIQCKLPENLSTVVFRDVNNGH